MSEALVTVDPGAEENGLAGMVAELLRENVATSARKREVFGKMKARIGLHATDADVKLTLVFDRGRCTVLDGLVEPLELSVATDSETILALSNTKLVAGYPNLFDAAGREVARKIARKEVVIRGLLRHPVSLTRLTIVLSVN